jgi:hypothetical protein
MPLPGTSAPCPAITLSDRQHHRDRAQCRLIAPSWSKITWWMTACITGILSPLGVVPPGQGGPGPALLVVAGRLLAGRWREPGGTGIRSGRLPAPLDRRMLSPFPRPAGGCRRSRGAARNGWARPAVPGGWACGERAGMCLLPSPRCWAVTAAGSFCRGGDPWLVAGPRFCGQLPSLTVAAGVRTV